MREPLTHVKTFAKKLWMRLGGLVGTWAVCPSRLGCERSRVASLFLGHTSGPRRAANLPTTSAQLSHDTRYLRRTGPVLDIRRVGKHSDLVVGKLVKIWFGFAARTFRRHTPLVSHKCVSGSSFQNFKVAHYRYS
jgi:hypothetical protein